MLRVIWLRGNFQTADLIPSFYATVSDIILPRNEPLYEVPLIRETNDHVLKPRSSGFGIPGVRLRIYKNDTGASLIKELCAAIEFAA